MTNETDIAIRDDAGQALATRGATRSEIALSPDQTSWTPKQVAALRQLGIEDAPEGDLDVFFHRCRTTGLDPFAKQIYMIGRNTKVTEWVNNRPADRWVVKYTIQTGIDGYRVLGNRLAAERGDDLDHDEALWCGKDGQWVDIWLDTENPPVAAKYIIRKNGKPFIAKVLYSEYVQTNNDGKPNATWKKRPAGQLAKCAEAAAWRMAYPQDFAGVELDAAVTIEPDGSPSPVRSTSERASAGEILGGGGGGGALSEVRQWQAPSAKDQAERAAYLAALDDGDRRYAADQAVEAASNSRAKPSNAQVDQPKTAAAKSTRAQQQHISKQLEKLGATEKAQKLAYVQAFFQREFETVAGLTRAEADEVIDTLDQQVAELRAEQQGDSVAEATDTNDGEQAALDTEGGDQ